MFEGSGTGVGVAVPAVPRPAADADVVCVEAVDPCLSAPLASLVAAVAAVRAQVAAELPGPQALAEAAVLLHEWEKLQALVLRRLADVDRRGLAALAGAPTTSSWVASQQCGLDRGQVTLARRLGRLALVEAAVGDGLVPLSSARTIAGALERLAPWVDRPDGLLDGQPAEPVLHAVITLGVLDLVAESRGGMEDGDPLLAQLRSELAAVAAGGGPGLVRLEAALLVLARHLEPGLLGSATARIVDALLPQQLAERADRARDNRGFNLQRRPDGSGWTVSSGDLDLECGELLWTVLQAEMATDPDGPTDTANAAAAGDGSSGLVGLDTVDCRGIRSLRQRRHDALRLALRRYLDTGIAGLRDKVTPHLSVTVSIEALSGQPGALLALSASGATLPTQLVRSWACDSTLTRFVLSLGHRVLEMSHTSRTLKAHERRLKHLETGGRCQGAGCTRGPGTPLVPHHPTAFARSGTTSVTDTVLLCEQTHAQLHRGATVRLRDGRCLDAGGWRAEPDP